ncbi:MAG: hypothetical protein ACEY3M_19655 [Wolbachia sp.]
MSIDELTKITPVKTPIVNKNTNPEAHIIEDENFIVDPFIGVANQLKT